MSSHPGSTLKEAIKLAEYLRDIKYQPEQVQDFYPTPGTLSTTMFYTGLDPITMKKVYVPKTKEEKAMQRALLQFSKPKNYNIVYDALMKAGREDLIGNGPKCLIKSKEQRYKEAHGLVRKKSINNGKKRRHLLAKEMVKMILKEYKEKILQEIKIIEEKKNLKKEDKIDKSLQKKSVNSYLYNYFFNRA